jgi:hypothetical protein
LWKFQFERSRPSEKYGFGGRNLSEHEKTDVVLVSEDAGALEILRGYIAKLEGKTVRVVKRKENA